MTESGRFPRKSLLTATRAIPAEVARLEKQFNRAGTDFLKLDVVTALIFTATALKTDDPHKKKRNQESARKAYDTVVRMAKRVRFQDEDAHELKNALHQLKSNLMRLGEIF